MTFFSRNHEPKASALVRDARETTKFNFKFSSSSSSSICFEFFEFLSLFSRSSSTLSSFCVLPHARRRQSLHLHSSSTRQVASIANLQATSSSSATSVATIYVIFISAVCTSYRVGDAGVGFILCLVVNRSYIYWIIVKLLIPHFYSCETETSYRGKFPAISWLCLNCFSSIFVCTC
jgi:hypothetical protein